MPRPRRDGKTIPQQETFLSKPRILVGEASAHVLGAGQKDHHVNTRMLAVKSFHRILFPLPACS